VKRTFLVLVGSIAAAALLAVHPVGAQEEFNPARRQPAHSADDARRVLVKFRESGAAGRVRVQAAEDKVAALAERAGVGVRGQRRLGAVLHVLDLDAAQSVDEQLARVRADASVEYAALDQRRHPHAQPDDPLYSTQWYLQADLNTPSAIDAEHAWDLTTGSSGVVIAVIDTGVRYDHPDLGHAAEGGRLLPGYDFVSDVPAANDGDGRDADASDPGDFVSTADLGTAQFRDCDFSDSSWHGTRVSGLIGARTNNLEGIAGGTWSPWILPVRVLGKCGGFDSDILAGMLWAGGVHVDGVPDNAYPAKIENLSLGAITPCPPGSPYQDVIDELATRGVVVVASAGNEGGPVGSPANCRGAVGVAGLRHAGTKVGYSSLGPEIAISAPAGNCVNTRPGEPCLFSIGTTVNRGATVPGTNSYTDLGGFNVGTSFSAPIVAGITGLMAAANGNLGAAQLRARLREGASKPFPVSTALSDPTDPMSPPIPVCHVPLVGDRPQGSECNCTTDTCGAGMANALGAVRAALRPITAVATPVTVSPGQNVPLSGVGSAAACGRTLTSYAWSVVTGADIITGNRNAPMTVVVAPGSGASTVRLTVTDDQGAEDFADIVVSATAATTSAPAAAGSTACLALIPAPPQNVQVTVAPVSVTVQPGTTATFVATVTNTANTSVSWHVDGVLGGNATVGTITTTGVYTAPASVSATTTMTVMAAWNGDLTRTGSAQVTVMAPAPPASSGGGGGGGPTGWLDLVALLSALALTARRRKDAAGARS